LVSVLCLKDIIDEMHDDAAPGGFIKPFGYVIVASSAGGNVVCFQSATGKVFWADHESFDGGIMLKNRQTGTWEFLQQYSAENVERAMVSLSNGLESFMADLLDDRLSDILEALDLGRDIANGTESKAVSS
jgi:hypothetical protein